MKANGDRARLSIDGGVAIITLAREDRLNAFDEAMHDALSACLAEAEMAGGVRALVLTGEGRAFSAGQDLGERAAAFADGGIPDIYGSLDKRYNPLVRRFAEVPFPIIACVDGIAFGGGAAIAVAADITLASVSARFQFGFVNVGLGPDSGASWRLPRLVGTQRAMELMLSGRAVDGQEAERIGLIARCVADGRVLAEALDLAHRLAGQSAEAVASIKRSLRGAVEMTFAEALDAERDAQAALGRTQAYRDAVLRFSARYPS
jgi:2-(1,2-epoxy-1,2-dihydrophenyl)acetyl-CoA isomerase